MQQRYLFFPALLILSIVLFSKQTVNGQSNNESTIFITSMQNMQTMNTYLEASNKDVLKSMSLITETKTQYLPLTNAASKILASSTALNTYISRLKNLIEEGDHKTSVEKVLMTEKKGIELFEQLKQLGKDHIERLDGLWQGRGIYSTIFADNYRKSDLLKKFSDQLLFLPSNNATDSETWVKENFKDKTIEEVFITLTNIQNQVNLSSNNLMRFLSEQIGRLNILYDRFNIAVQANKPSVRPGETYKAEIGLATFSSQADFSISVNGQKLVMKEGKGQYEVTSTTPGEKEYRAAVRIANPLTGEVETFSQTFKYEVTESK